MRTTQFWFLFLLLIVFTACQPSAGEPTPTLVIPTAVAPTPIVPPLAEVTEPTELPPPPTTVILPTMTPEPTAVPAALQFQVAYVTRDDTLNVRSGPGVDYEVVGELNPQADDVEITGSGRVVEGSTWVPVTDGRVTGWVNSRFLTGVVPAANFCEDEAVNDLVDAFMTAVSERDNAALARLIHPERGLRMHTYWWNPEVLINGDELQRLFSSNTTYDWGVEDGSGLPIEGSFAAVIVPELERDLLPATDGECQEILHGATAGLVQLPDGYEQVPFVSLHRPAPDDEIGFDWGTWVLGIEKWNGRYYLSYLVHYQWEI